MTKKELKRCSKADLVELLLYQQNENERLRAEMEEMKQKQKTLHLKLSRVGSLAEASLAVTKVFEEAQRAADYYLDSLRKLANVPAEKKERDVG